MEFNEASPATKHLGTQLSLIAAAGVILAVLAFLEWPSIRAERAVSSNAITRLQPAQTAAALPPAADSVYTFYFVNSEEQGREAAPLIASMRPDDSPSSVNLGIAIVRNPADETRFRDSIEASNEEQSSHSNGQLMRIVDLRGIMP
jgi:hypothetical protein